MDDAEHFAEVERLMRCQQHRLATAGMAEGISEVVLPELVIAANDVSYITDITRLAKYGAAIAEETDMIRVAHRAWLMAPTQEVSARPWPMSDIGDLTNPGRGMTVPTYAGKLVAYATMLNYYAECSGNPRLLSLQEYERTLGFARQVGQRAYVWANPNYSLS